MKLFIGNLPFSLTEASLQELFEQNGVNVVSVKIITDRYTGRPRGFGFVEVSSAEEGKNAIEQLNGKEIEGRALAVNEAREEGSRPRRSGGGGRHSHNRDDRSRREY